MTEIASFRKVISSRFSKDLKENNKKTLEIMIKSLSKLDTYFPLFLSNIKTANSSYDRVKIVKWFISFIKALYKYFFKINLFVYYVGCK